MKKIISLIMILTMLFTVSGCNFHKTENSTEPSREAVETGNRTVTFTDDLGRSITVTNPQRTAALLGSYADMWMLAGGSICASADDAWEDLNLELNEDTVNLGSAHRPDKEALLGAQPDFVIASPKLSKQLGLKDSLEDAGIPAAFFDVSDFISYLRVFKIMTDITGKTENYKKYGTDQQKKITEILERNKDKDSQTVLVMRASAGSIRAKNSNGTMLGGMLKDFGTVNIADSDSMILDNLNIESIAEKNPDKIFFVETGDDIDGIKKNVEAMFNENPLWKKLDAVKNGRVYYMEKNLYNLKPNARFTEAYEKLEKILYE